MDAKHEKSLESKGNLIAKFDNKIIEAAQLVIVDGRGEISSFSPEEHKIFVEAVSRLTVEDDASRHIRIDLRDFLKEKGVSEKNYSYVRKLANSLRTKGLKIKVRGDFEVVVNIFSYTGGEGTRYLIVGFNSDLVPFLLKLKGDFTQIPKKEVFKLASSYSIKLYQLLKRFEDTGKRVDKVEELREKLGIRENSYKTFKELNRKVLRKAVEDINRLTDIYVSYETVKQYRKVTHVIFYIQKKGDNVVDVDYVEDGGSFGQKWKPVLELRSKYSDLFNKLSFNRLTENQVLFLLENLNHSLYPLEVAIEIIKRADENVSLKNPMGFLITTFHIDVKKAKYKELTLTPRKIDQELFKKELEKDVVEPKPAKDMAKELFVALKKSGVDRGTLRLLKEPLINAFVDEVEDLFYIPVPDEVFKEWLVSNFLESFESFLKERFGISGVAVKVIGSDREL